MTEPTDHKGESRGAETQPAPAHPELKASDLVCECCLPVEELERTANQQGDGIELLGQERAFDAIRLALGVEAPGYNVFVGGLRTREERQSILRVLEARSEERR